MAKINKQEFDEYFHEAFVYKWVRISTKEFYVGVHLGNPNDNYVGSGRVFIDKYKSNPDDWVREYVIPCFTYEEALELEELIVDEELILRKECLNLRTGGRQGRVAEETKAQISKSTKGKPKSEKHKQNMKKPKSKEHARKVGNAMKKKVRCIETNIVYDSATDAAKFLKGNLNYRSTQGNISSVCSRNRNTACGYHWEKV